MSLERSLILLGSIAAVFSMATLVGTFVDDEPADTEVIRACPLVDCSGKVHFDLHQLPRRARSVEICANKVCGTTSTKELRSAGNHLQTRLEAADLKRSTLVKLRVTVFDGDGRKVETDDASAVTKLEFPYGKQCPPCWDPIETEFRDGKIIVRERSS